MQYSGVVFDLTLNCFFDQPNDLDSFDFGEEFSSNQDLWTL